MASVVGDVGKNHLDVISGVIFIISDRTESQTGQIWMGRQGDETEKALGQCTGCGAVCSVWVETDGSVRPISPENDCSCAEPSFEALGEDLMQENTDLTHEDR